MNPNLHRHLFVRYPSEAQYTLPDDFQFMAERGERCVPLTACWPELLIDCQDIGPVALVSQNAGAQFARSVSDVDFAPVPGSTEMVELRSGLVADTSEWSHALAVEEPLLGGSLFSLQFFTPDGAGLWKLLLTRDAQLEHFAGMVRHYASGSPPPPPRPQSERSTLTRVMELQQRGCGLAHEVPSETLAMTLLTARREERPLNISVGRNGLLLSGAVTPRSLERCPCAVHVYDHCSEVHLATGEDFSVWRVLERSRWTLEILDGDGALTARVGG